MRRNPIYYTLQKQINKWDLLPSEPAGPGGPNKTLLVDRSTLANLMRLTHTADHLDIGGQVDVICTYFSKAFKRLYLGAVL